MNKIILTGATVILAALWVLNLSFDQSDPGVVSICTMFLTCSYTIFYIGLCIVLYKHKHE